MLYTEQTPNPESLKFVTNRMLYRGTADFREEELARYDQWLAEIEAGIGTPVSQRQVRGWIEEVIAAAERIEESMLQVAVDFGATVSDGQMEEFIDNLWEKQREYEDEFLSRSDQEYVDDLEQSSPVARMTGHFVERR